MKQLKVYCLQENCPVDFICSTDKATMKVAVGGHAQSSYAWYCEGAADHLYFSKTHAEISKTFNLDKTSLMGYRLFREING